MAAAGAAVANSTQAGVAGIGVAMLLAGSPMALTMVGVAGGLYLLWLGIKSSRMIVPGWDRRNDDTNREKSSGKNFAAFRDGLAVNLLNPAITTFYVAVVPSFVPRGAPGWHYAMLAAAHVVIAFGCHAFWTVAFEALGHHARKPPVRRALDVITGLVLIALAISILARSMSGATSAAPPT